MSLKSRPYNGLCDFIVMTSILAAGRKTAEEPYYAHIGDLSWWMFYADHDDIHWCQHISLWEQDGHPCGWSLIDPDWCSFDVYLLPEMQGGQAEAVILDLTIDQIMESVRKLGNRQIKTMWVSENDSVRINQLVQRGFVRSENFKWVLEHPLNARIPNLALPNAFMVRPIRGESDLHQRAAASHIAFGSTHPLEEYESRYQRFMRSPVYHSNFDLVTEAPDGQFPSFCIIWPDPVNRMGLFEPVGTQTHFQSLGLGRAVITEGLQRLEDCGMNRAMVCAEANNPAALKLYEAVGFQKKQQLLTYTKSI